MKEKVYKIVKPIVGKLISARTKGEAQVEYRINEWSEAPVWLANEKLFLCVFKDKEYATMIRNKYEKDCLLFKCDGEEVHEPEGQFCSTLGLTNKTIKVLEKEKFPKRTLFAKRVKLLQEV